MFAGWKPALPGGQRTRRNVSPPRVPVKTDGRTDGRTWGAGDAHDLGCEQELRHVLIIIRDGSSADRQLDHFRLRRLEGDTEEEALRAVVDLVVAETREGIDAAG